MNIPTNIFSLEDERGPSSPPFIALPYAIHGDLRSYKARIEREDKQLSLQEITRVLYQVILGLQALHSKECGIIHHDLQPRNILVSEVTSNGEIAEISITDHDTGSCIFEVGQGKNKTGTLGYMAPEKISGGSNTPDVDFFSLGIVGLFLMDEEAIFYNETKGDILLYQVGRMYRSQFFDPYQTTLRKRIEMAVTEEELERVTFIAEYILPLIDPTPTVRSQAATRLIRAFAEEKRVGDPE